MFAPIPIAWFRIHDTIASSLGLFLNLLLISAAWKRTNPAFRSYGHMVLVYAINDTIYALVSLTCQRIIELKNGTLFHMGFGLEVGAPTWLSQTVEFSNEVVCMQATAIIPTVYYFRYVLVSKTRQATTRLLILLTFFSTALSVTFGISDLLSRSAASKRGTHYYVKQLDDYWNEVNSTAAFTSANDMDDISTITHFFIGVTNVIVCYGIALFYAYKTLKIIKSQIIGRVQSQTSARLTREFSRNLFIQTAITQICAVLPSSYLATYIVFRLSFFSYGPITSSLLALNPAANALVTLSVIRPYRLYALELLRLKCLTKKVDVSISAIGTSSFGATRREQTLRSSRVLSSTALSPLSNYRNPMAVHIHSQNSEPRS